MKRENGITIEQIENRINSAFDAATPDRFKQVLESCKEQKGNSMENIIALNHSERTNKGRRLIAIIAAAAAFVFIIAGVIAASINAGRDRTFVTVQLDVNPSIEIKVDNDERVISIDALNADGEQLIKDLDFSGSTIEVAVNAIVGSMLKNGYLNDIANSILVSVEGKNAEASALIQQKLTEDINAILNAAAFNGAVLSQVIASGDQQLEQLAKEYGITHGKARLILAIVEKHQNYHFEELVPMTITELNLLAAGDELIGFDMTGKPESSNYIGANEVIAIALSHAGVLEEDVIVTECELEYDDGKMVYELEFNDGAMEYEYTIDATNGTVLEYESEPLDLNDSPKPSINPPATTLIPTQSSTPTTPSAPTGTPASTQAPTQAPTPAPSTQAYIGEQRAKEIAFKHAGVNETNVWDLEIELDYEHGAYYYEIEFKCGSYEYEYEINAVTGSIYHCDKEYNDDHDHNGHNDHDDHHNHSNTPIPTDTH